VARVSILIPAYHERFFGEAFESARAQTDASIEILVCDDSPDRAIEDRVAAARDPRVRYLRNNPRRGFEGNFTFALSEARGELVKFLNDDDRLRPACVAHLAAAFDDDPRVTLATSRRAVIDSGGLMKTDLPATMPVSYATCTIDGFEMGNLALVNGLNLIGEPTTAMFRKRDVQVEAGGLFTWNGRSYHCLADLSLWLRLMARGRAHYCANVLSEYRVHPGQAQRGGDMGLDFITERLDLARSARDAGYLAQPMQYRTALERIQALASAWDRRPGLGPAQHEELAAFSRKVAAALAALPA